MLSSSRRKHFTDQTILNSIGFYKKLILLLEQIKNAWHRKTIKPNKMGRIYSELQFSKHLGVYRINDSKNLHK